MEALLSDLYASTTIPILSALLLGLLNSVAPCPMTLNITAVGFIGKDIANKNRIFINGLFYALGTIFSYTVLAYILYFGADQFKISSLFQQYSEKIIGPLLVIIGILMLGIIKLNFPAFTKLTARFQTRKSYSRWDAFLLGGLLALAFCPYNGVLYFGMLIPLTISTSGLILPVVFSIGAAIPVLIFAWLLAFALSGVGRAYNRIKLIEKWVRIIVAILFISVGIYLVVVTWF